MHTSTTLLTEADVADQLGVDPSTVRRIRRNDPSFPQPIRITQRTVRYRQADVERWIASKQTAPPTPGRPRKGSRRAVRA